VSSKIIVTTSVTRLFHNATQNLPDQDHGVQDQDTRPIFWSQTGLLLKPTDSDHITETNTVKALPAKLK